MEIIIDSTNTVDEFKLQLEKLLGFEISSFKLKLVSINPMSGKYVIELEPIKAITNE